MFAGYKSIDQMEFDFRPAAPQRKRPHYVFAALMFLAAYFTTITVHAQSDGITLTSNKMASVTGTVTEADENWIVVNSAGKDMRIVLDDVHMQGEADTIFTPGMTVTVDGTMAGDDFGTPLMKAKTVTATAPAAPVTAVGQP